MKNKIELAKQLMHRVFLAIAVRPDELKLTWERSPGLLEATVQANPADTRRLVGRNADNLKMLSALFRLLAYGTGVHVKILDLVPNENPAPAFFKLTTDPEWPRQDLETLLRDLAEEIFETPVIIVTELPKPSLAKMYAMIQADMDEKDSAMTLFNQAVNVLFLPMGWKYGIEVRAHANDWKSKGTATAIAN